MFLPTTTKNIKCPTNKNDFTILLFSPYNAHIDYEYHSPILTKQNIKKLPKILTHVYRTDHTKVSSLIFALLSTEFGDEIYSRSQIYVY